MLLAVICAAGQELKAFSYPDAKTARQHWTPQFGSVPVRVEAFEDGTTCLALDADFAKPQDRACWDWSAPLDLSQVSRITFDVSATNGGLTGTVGLYFGTPKGWYARFWGGVSDEWTPRTFRLDAFGTEDAPDGWDKIISFRFSVWSAGAGKATYRLRNLRALADDPGENFVKNGSFEVPGLGVPYAWGSGHWGVGRPPWATDMDRWRQHWHADETEARHGRSSLCVDNTSDWPLLKAQSVWITPPKAVKECVASAWLKSDQNALPVTLECGGRSVATEVGAEWSQVALKAIPRRDRMTLIIAPQDRGKLWIDAVQLQTCAEPTTEFHPSFGDEAIASREERVDWSPPRRSRGVAAGRTVTGPVDPAPVAIDEHGRLLVGGKPYIQHSLGLEFVPDLDILDFAARSGFADVCIQIRESVTTDELRAIFDRCAHVGLRTIPWLDRRIPRERLREHITALRDHPALLCWYVYDEPSGEGFAEAEARLALAKELDSSRPAFINYLSSKLEDHKGDIYSTDVYPIPHGAPSSAINAVARMRAAAAKESKPVWMWLQGTGYAYWMDREPSPRELSCMAYGSLIAGARGIYYFAQIPRTRECFDEMRALCVEIDALTPALCGLDEAPEALCDQPNIMCRAFAYAAELWVLAVNTQSAACEAKLTLPGAEGKLAVVFEGRSVEVGNESWRDTFGPYERHVYRLAP